MRPRLLASLVLAAVTSLAAPRLAHAADAPDIVKLKDGSMYRGTIAEMVPGDHLVIVLATGETRRFEMKDVVTAGPPASPPPAPPPPAAPPSSGPAGAALALSANEDDITFNLKTGQAELDGVGFVGSRAVAISATADSYTTMCIAPCTTTLPTGTHQIGLAQRDGRVIAAEETVTITGPGRLDGTYTSHLGVRIGGIVVLVGGNAAGLGLVLAGMNSKEECDQPLFAGDPPFCHKTMDGTLVGAGIGLALVGSLVGWIMLSVKDTATVEFTPGPNPVAKTREGVGFDARGLVVRF